MSNKSRRKKRKYCGYCFYFTMRTYTIGDPDDGNYEEEPYCKKVCQKIPEDLYTCNFFKEIKKSNNRIKGIR